MGKDTRSQRRPDRAYRRFLRRNLPLGVAMGALAFTVYQGCLDRQVARFSVRPIIQLSSVAAPAPEFPQVGLYVTNDGAGVALIDAITLTFEGGTLEGKEGPLGSLAKLLRSRYPDFPPILFCTQVAEAIPSNAKECLFGIAGSDSTPERSAVLRQFLSGLAVNVRYRSLYNERFETDSQFK